MVRTKADRQKPKVQPKKSKAGQSRKLQPKKAKAMTSLLKLGIEFDDDIDAPSSSSSSSKESKATASEKMGNHKRHSSSFRAQK